MSCCRSNVNIVTLVGVSIITIFTQYNVFTAISMTLAFIPLLIMLYATLRGMEDSNLCMDCQQCVAVCPVMKVKDSYNVDAVASAGGSFAAAYVGAAMAILTAPFRADLAVLDRDAEFLAYQRRFGWSEHSPDFHPPRGRLRQGFCSLSHEEARAWVDALIAQIEGREEQRDADGRRTAPAVESVAEDMAHRFIRLYERVIDALEEQIQAVPPPAASDIATMQAEIAQLEAKIDDLEQFLATL